MSSIYLKKLLLKSLQTDHKNYIYLHSEWHEDVVNLHLKDPSTRLYYKGQLVAKDFEEPSAELEIPLNDFRTECKNVLTSTIGLPGFEIELDSERKVLRVNKNNEFCMQYLEIKLTEADKSYEMLDIALNIIDDGKSESENQNTSETMSNLVDQVEQILREKEEWKEKMLNKFLVLLNTKKQKISILQKKIENIEKRSNHDRQIEEMNAENSSGTSLEGDQMDYQAREYDSISDAREQNDFDAPTQQMTAPTNI